MEGLVMKAYKCRECGQITEKPKQVDSGDNDPLDFCPDCESLESFDVIEVDENFDEVKKWKN